MECMPVERGAQGLHQREIWRSSFDSSLITLGFICHVREGIIGDLPCVTYCGRPYSYLKSIHNKVDIIKPSYVDKKIETHRQ